MQIRPTEDSLQLTSNDMKGTKEENIKIKQEY